MELVDFLDVLDRDEYNNSRWIVEEILSVMNTLDIDSITRNLSYEKFKTSNLFGEDNTTYHDPYIYFYENFLAAYDKKLRKQKGVYYTPNQVVNFIVRSINEILKDIFKIESGFSDKDKVTVLDFATGTGTFILEILELIFDELPKGSGKKNLLIRNHILKNFYGFEYLIAPYTIANLKLSQFLKDHGYKFQDDDRFQIYLTNTLEHFDKKSNIPLLPTLSKETNLAKQVKENPILVITGNPPYSGISKNNGDWIKNLISTYKFVDGKPFGEKKHWLNDDYVKFIRFAQWKMDQEEEGIVGIITNHRFISNPTFRGMRQSLMASFDQIYILDLHGSNKPKEIAPNGEPDENVFDIEQGVAISFFIKKPGIEKKFFHKDLFGRRIEKYNFCLKESIQTLDWVEIKPKSPFYLFNESSNTNSDSYDKFPKIDDIFPFHKLPLMTGRDSLSISFTTEGLMKIINDLNSLPEHDIRVKYSLKEDKSNWNLPNAIKDVKETKADQSLIRKLFYRPFDKRVTYYTGKTNGLQSRPQYSVNKHLACKNNFGLIVGRAGQNVDATSPWNLVFICDDIADLNMFSRGGAMIFPLYLIQEGDGLFSSFGNYLPNINQKFFDGLAKTFNKSISVEDILGYIYAILHSPSYRSTYKVSLNIDFPRIPFTNDFHLFKSLSKLGWDIINAQLFKSVPLIKDYAFGFFKGNGDNVVRKRNFIIDPVAGEFGKLYINDKQYFDCIPKDVWNFNIGGYQVLDKYLKDRNSIQLDLCDIESIENIIRIISFMLDKMNEIDNLTKSWV